MNKFIVALSALFISTFSNAADLPRKTMLNQPTVSAPLTAPNSSWSGLYVGAHLGYDFGSTKVGWEPMGQSADTINNRGMVAGFQVGYDVQFNNFVVGAAADYSLTSNQGKVAENWNTLLSVASTINNVGTLRGRVGVLANNNLLIYGTAGFAVASVNVNNGLANFNQIGLGYTLGLGAEYRFTKNISGFAEYRNTKVSVKDDGATFFGAPFFGNIKTNTNNIRIGVNYRF